MLCIVAAQTQKGSYLSLLLPLWKMGGFCFPQNDGKQCHGAALKRLGGGIAR